MDLPSSKEQQVPITATIASKVPPSASTVAIKKIDTIPKNILYAKYVLRCGLAFVFTYAAISMSLTPNAYANYIPDLIQDLNILPTTTFLHLFGAFEIILSIWMLVGKKGYLAALLSALLLMAITVLNPESFGVLFRNVGIISAALALMMLEHTRI